jgi:hypothetical protein
MPFFFDFLQRTLHAWILFIERPAGMRGQIDEWIDTYIQSTGCDSNIKHRFLFRHDFPDSPGLYSLFTLTDASLDAVGGNYSAHTTAQDALMHVPHFCTNDPNGLMQSRVGAEISIAAGLERVCVGKTCQETIDLLVQYAHDSEAQLLVPEFIAANRREKNGLFCERRSADAWKAVLENYLEQGQQAQVKPVAGNQFSDFHIPLHGRIVIYPDGATEPAAACAATTDKIQQNLDLMMRLLEPTTEVEMRPVLLDMLRGIQLESGVEFMELVGSGTFMNTIRCQTEAGELVALKIAKNGRPADRMHNDPALRHSLNCILWYRRTRKSEIESLLPAPCYLLGGGTSCIGTSKPNQDNKVLAFLFEEFIQGVPLTDLIWEHKKSWQEDGVLHDKLRLGLFNPLYQGVFWLGHFGLAIMGINSDNVMMRTEGPLKGRIAFVNLSLGHTFKSNKGMKSQLDNSQDSNGQPALLTRRCTSIMYTPMRKAGLAAGVGGRKLVRLGRPKKDQLVCCINRAQIQEFLNKATKEGLANLGAGSSGLKEVREVIEKQEAERAPRKLFDSAGKPGNLGRFDPKWGLAADLLAVNKMLFELLTFQKDDNILDWNARTTAAAQLGEEGIRKMLLASLKQPVEPETVKVQQTLAFERLVDLFVRGLGPGERRDAEQTMTCAMNTLPILPAEDELTLRKEGSIMLPRGVLNFPGLEQIHCPAVSFAVQERLREPDSCVTEDTPARATKRAKGSGGGKSDCDKARRKRQIEANGQKVRSSKGIGVRAEEDIPKGAVLGAYAGFPAMNAEIGRPYLTLKYPSRYVAVVMGNIPELKRQNQAKVSVDAQVTMIHDWRFVKISRNVGPYLNAPDTDDPGDEANCVLDRHSLTQDAEGMYWMLIKTNQFVPKGTFLQWDYNPTAGPAGFWKLS